MNEFNSITIRLFSEHQRIQLTKRIRDLQSHSE